MNFQIILYLITNPNLYQGFIDALKNIKSRYKVLICI